MSGNRASTTQLLSQAPEFPSVLDVAYQAPDGQTGASGYQVEPVPLKKIPSNQTWAQRPLVQVLVLETDSLSVLRRAVDLTINQHADTCTQD